MLVSRLRSAMKGPAPVTDPWWYLSSTEAVAAWLAIGADSQADSYLDLTENGNHLSQIGTIAVPSWSAAAGWTYTGAEALGSILFPDGVNGDWSMLVVQSGWASAGTCVLAGSKVSGTQGFLLGWNSTKSMYRYTGLKSVSTADRAEGAMILSAQSGYWRGWLKTSTISFSALTFTNGISIGAYRTGSTTVENGFVGNILGVAIYDGTIPTDDIPGLTTRAQALIP